MVQLPKVMVELLQKRTTLKTPGRALTRDHTSISVPSHAGRVYKPGAPTPLANALNWKANG